MSLRVASIVYSMALMLSACGSSSNSGVVAGAQDAHCAGITTDPRSAFSCSTAPSGTDTSSGTDYGDTMYNATGDDDDCKWHVSWSATDIEQNKNVALTVKATWIVDGTPVTGSGANTRAEIFLSDTHVAPFTNPTVTENPNGTYLISPVQFDEKGKWTTRFHFFEDCVDENDSLHGHAAFYMNVP